MNVVSVNSFFKQATMLMLCGLLPCFCMAQQRSKGEAEKVACDFVSKNAKLSSKADFKLSLTSSLISSNEGICSDKEAYYIFSNTSNNAGFIIVSGDERMPTVLAYSEENNFDVNNIPPNVRYWLDCYTESFLNLGNNVETAHVSLASANEDGVAPLLGNNSWDQGNPYNLLCPSVKSEKCVTGCVATAMAQVMNYYKHPIVGKGYVIYRTETNGIQLQNNLNAVCFKWEDMLDDYNKEYSPVQADAVAELMYACGTSVHMDYCTSSQGGSGAYQKDLIPAFVDNFDYDRDAAFMVRSYCSVEDWHRILINELNEGRPVNYAGQSIRDGGHSFVFDGYKVCKDNKYPDYHVNWGWGGSCNGYYQIANLHPVENELHATMGGFNSSQQIAIGIKPNDDIDNGALYLCTPNLYSSSTSVKPGNTIQIYSASLNNFSYKGFSGTLHVALISQEDGKELILGEGRVRTLGYLEEQSNINIEITLPLDLSNGKYTIQLRSKQATSKEYNQVYSSKYPELTISTTNNNNSVTASEVLLGCSELEIVKTTDPTVISLTLYELQNLLYSPFIGDLRMVLADNSGKQLAVFGDSIQPGELGGFEIQEEPLKIEGRLVGNWENGNYRLYVGARLINTSNYTYVSYYDITQPDKANQELFLDVQIQDGVLLINGHTYEILPTLVKSTSQSIHNGHSAVYNLNGAYIGDYHSIRSSMKKGLYIIREGNNAQKLLIPN